MPITASRADTTHGQHHTTDPLMEEGKGGEEEVTAVLRSLTMPRCRVLVELTATAASVGVTRLRGGIGAEAAVEIVLGRLGRPGPQSVHRLTVLLWLTMTGAGIEPIAEIWTEAHLVDQMTTTAPIPLWRAEGGAEGTTCLIIHRALPPMQDMLAAMSIPGEMGGE